MLKQIGMGASTMKHEFSLQTLTALALNCLCLNFDKNREWGVQKMGHFDTV
jgi:hypothetical protein